MSPDAGDFEAFVAARWPGLVRGLVEQGATPAQAHDLAAEALSRARRGWAAEQRDGDVEALVQRELAAVWRPRAADPEAEVTVLAPPTRTELDARTRARRSRTARRAAAVLLPLALVVAGLTWWAGRGEPAPENEEDDLGPTRVEPAANPLPVAWYADDELHLAQVTVRVEGLVDLVALGRGAVYGDDEGRVVLVDADGTRTPLGRKDVDAAIVATDESGLAAWVDTTGSTPRLVVAEGGAVVAELDADPGTRVIALDARTVFFRDERSTHAWLTDGDAVVPVTPADLVDVRSRIRAFQLGPAAIQVVQSFFDVAYNLPGNGAQLAPDGDVVASRLDASGYGRIALYDTSSGRSLKSGLADTDVALEVSLGAARTATYVVAQVGDMSRTGPFLRAFTGGDLFIRHCELGPVTCTDAVTLPGATQVPVLARG